MKKYLKETQKLQKKWDILKAQIKIITNNKPKEKKEKKQKELEKEIKQLLDSLPGLKEDKKMKKRRRVIYCEQSE